MRPRNLAWAGLAVAALSVSAFFLLEQPAHHKVAKVTPFEDEAFTISEERPDPPPHAFAIKVPSHAANARVVYYFEFSSLARRGGQEESINVIFSLYVDDEQGLYKDTTPLGKEEVNRAGIDYGRSSATSFAHVGRLRADLASGFHVIQLRIDTTDQMTEPWEWTITPYRFELEYDVSNGWRGGPAPFVGLVAGSGAAVALWGWAIVRAVRIELALAREPRRP